MSSRSNTRYANLNGGSDVKAANLSALSSFLIYDLVCYISIQDQNRPKKGGVRIPAIYFQINSNPHTVIGVYVTSFCIDGLWRTQGHPPRHSRNKFTCHYSLDEQRNSNTVQPLPTSRSPYMYYILNFFSYMMGCILDISSHLRRNIRGYSNSAPVDRIGKRVGGSLALGTAKHTLTTCK